MKKSVHITIKFSIGLILIASVFIGYWKEPEYLIELTCISNLLIGAIFFISAIRMAKNKKDFSNTVYLMSLDTIMFVFLICMGSLSGMYHMNFKGAFLFLHVVNPMLVLVYYFLFINENKGRKIKNILIIPFFTLAYLLIDFIVGTFTKKYVYGFFEPSELNLFVALLVGLSIYVVSLLVGLLFYNGNRLLTKKGLRLE